MAMRAAFSLLESELAWRGNENMYLMFSIRSLDSNATFLQVWNGASWSSIGGAI
jgi:hypothetical protein